MPTCSTEAPPGSTSGTAPCPSPRRTRRPKQDGTPCPSWHPRTSPHCLAAGETPWTTRTSQRWTGSMADPRNDSPLFDADAILRKAYFGVWLLSLVFAGFAIWGVILQARHHQPECRGGPGVALFLRAAHDLAPDGVLHLVAGLALEEGDPE